MPSTSSWRTIPLLHLAGAWPALGVTSLRAAELLRGRIETVMWRQGDVFIERVSSIPDAARQRGGTVIAHGELTGHSHRLADPSGAQLYHGSSEAELYLRASAAVSIVHDEHGPIDLPAGSYRLWRQREYTPRAIVTVRD